MFFKKKRILFLALALSVLFLSIGFGNNDLMSYAPMIPW